MGKKRKLDEAQGAEAIEIDEFDPFRPPSGAGASLYYPHFHQQQHQQRLHHEAFSPMASFWSPHPQGMPMFHPGAPSLGYQMQPAMHGPTMYPSPVPGISSADRIKYVEEVAVRIYQRLLAANQGISVAHLANSVCLEVGPNTIGWASMLEDIPCLKKLASVEEKANVFIVSYVAAHRIATLYDLVTELCSQEGVDVFEDLGLGSAVRYPLIVKYFSTSNVNEICKITSIDVLHHLSKFDVEREGKCSVTNLLNFIADKRGLPSRNHTGVRILSFGQHIDTLRKVKKHEKTVVEEWENMSKRHIKNMVQTFISSSQTKKAPSHIRFLEPEGELDDEVEASPPLETYSSCPYPSEREETSKLQTENRNFTLAASSVARFVSDWKDVACNCSVLAVIKQMLKHEVASKKQRKQLLEMYSSFPGLQLLNVAVLALKSETLPAGCMKSAEEGEKSAEEGEKSAENGGSPATDFDAINTKIAEHFNSFVPEKCGKGMEWQNFVRWASSCEKNLSKEISSSWTSLLEYMMQQLTSIELNSSKLMPPRKAAVPRHRVAAFVQQACNAKRDTSGSEPLDVVLRCCKQFQVSNREDLGLDDTESICALREEHAGTGLVFYAEALAGSSEQTQVETLNKVGRLGNVTSEDAAKCLAKAPVLSELHGWSQWAAVFEPQLGPLLDWIEENGAGSGISVLVTSAGNLLRIDGDPRLDNFLSAIAEGRSADTVGQLVSLAVLHGGAANAPMELLKSHSSMGLDILAAVYGETHQESRVGTKRKTSSPGEHGITTFVMDCLVVAPKEFRLLVAEVMYSAFSAMAQNAPELLLQTCRSCEHRSVLHFIGLELGVLEWISDYKSSGITVVAFDKAADNGEPSLKKQKCDDSGVTSEVKMEAMEIQQAEPDAEEPKDNTVVNAVVQVQPDAALPEQGDMQSQALLGEEASKVIEDIRREEFGLEQGSSKTGDDLLSRQHARIGRALHCLSHNLYSEDCHFILELVQNADDNAYPSKVSPALAFVIQEDRIIVLNNEQGFAAKNIRALCDIGNSTKSGSKAGYIGHKGIGFKSVFRVTDAPEIHSNGFHVKFDISETTLGFILPTPVGVPVGDREVRQFFTEDSSVAELSISNTRIDLPFRPSSVESTKPVSSLFFDLHPNLLLFLHKLRTLVVRDEILSTTRVFHRHDLGRSLVKVTDCGAGETYLIVQHQLPAAVARPGVLSTELACAFGLKELSDGCYESHPVQQQVFAFLPVRSYGLKFIVQGDFILPSSREEVDRDSAWNQWLLSEIPKLFVQASTSFKSFTGFRSRAHAVTSYMSFVPLEGEVLGFFSSVPRMILSQLRAAPCLPTADSVTWALPCMTLRGWDDAVRQLVSDDLLREHLGMVYLDKDVVLSNTLACSLGVPEYGTGILASLMKSVCKKRGALEKLGVGWVRSWLLALHRCILCNKQKDGDCELLQSLTSSSFIPLSSGEFTSLEKGPVWFLNSSATEGAENDDFQNGFLALYSELRTVSPLFLLESLGDGSGEAGIVKHMLKRLGVKVVSAHEIIKSHILPMMAREDCLQKDAVLVVQYLAYCMLHLQLHKCGTCELEKPGIMNELRQNAVVLTDAGLKRIKQEKIHFPAAMKNVVDMKKMVGGTGVEWSELADGYLGAIPSNLALVGTNLWRKFFTELGVTDFVQTASSTVRLSDTSASVWRDEIPEAENEGKWVIEDCECPEVRDILTVMTSSPEARPEQCALFLSAFDKMWDDNYEQFSKARYRLESSGEAAGVCTSSFVFELRKFSWIKSSLDGKLRKPEELFHRCDAVENLLGSCGPFAVPQVKSARLVKALGLRTQVSLQDVTNLFQNIGATTSLDQMERVYKFLDENLSAKRLRKFFKSNSCIFVPATTVRKRQEAVPGKFFSRAGVTWQDPFDILDKLEETDEFPVKTLHKHYPGLHSFFVDQCAVSDAPKFDDYIGVIQQLAARLPPSKVSAEVLKLFTAWSEEIQNGTVESEEISRRKQLLRDKKALIFPTRKDTWVSLRSKYLLCWCDDEQLLSEFEDVNDAIQFIDFKKTKKKKATTKVCRFLQSLGISKFSEVVEREVSTHQGNEYRELQDIIKWIVPYAQRYLLQFQEDAYNSFLASDQRDQLANLACFEANQVSFRYVVRHKDRSVTSRRRIRCGCLLQDDKLHVASSHAKDYAAIFLELSRLFFAGETNNHLANFLHLTLLQAHESPTEGTLESLIATSQGIPPLPDDQTPWRAAGPSPVNQESKSNQDLGANASSVTAFAGRDLLQFGGAPNEKQQEQREMTGRTGEMLVYQHLCRKYGGDRVKWVNENMESGAAYDIVIESSEEEGQRSQFVEVKSTRSSNKDWFEVTPNEWDFAKEAASRYTIIRATLMENQKRANLMTLRDPVRLCQEKTLKLAILLPKQQQKN